MNAKKSIRMSYVFPIIVALILIVVDAIGIIKGYGPHSAQYVLENYDGKIQSLLINCGLDLFISYVPASVFSVICFALAQQKIYGIPAGLAENNIVFTYVLIIVYTIIYTIFLVVGNDIWTKSLFVAFTVLCYICIWKFSIDLNYKIIKENSKPDPANLEETK